LRNLLRKTHYYEIDSARKEPKSLRGREYSPEKKKGGKGRNPWGKKDRIYIATPRFNNGVGGPE